MEKLLLYNFAEFATYGELEAFLNKYFSHNESSSEERQKLKDASRIDLKEKMR